MIDNHGEAMELVRKMKAQLPISARPTKAFIDSMRQNNIRITSEDDLQIESVLYMGDEGGIGCAVSFPGQKQTVVVTSVTHIHVEPSHLLAKDIRVYQMKRTRKLAQTNSRRKSTRFTVKPRRKDKSR
jgi:hypothetical protein